MPAAARSVGEILDGSVSLEVESIDRLYLNAYVPGLQRELGVVGFFRGHRGQPVASSALMAPISRAFVRAIEAFVDAEDVPLVKFRRGERKDDVAKRYLAGFEGDEGVLFVGKAQEKVPVFRTEKRRDRQGRTYPWIVRSTAMVNQYYFYLVDADFGPFFIKFSSYFPYTAKVCLNGHEYLKRQLAKEGIAFEALDNGIESCADPVRMQEIADGLSADKIWALFAKWLDVLPHPFTDEDTDAGYRYDLSILQAEFSFTQVLDRPRTGRILFEEIIRENLDLGRPDQVQLVFGRRVTRRTPGRFRTRVITQGVIPSLHFYYKSTHIKQYHKEGQALRTETTINDTRDFQIGKRLKNLPALREVGFQANRRLLDVQRLSHDCRIGDDAFQQVVRPLQVDNQRVSALRFDDERVQRLLNALVVFRLQPYGFTNRDLREHIAPLLGLEPGDITPGRMTYDLRRLRLHGLIERIPHTHRYRLTDLGLRTALFFTRAYARIIRDGLARTIEPDPAVPCKLRTAFRSLETAMDGFCHRQGLAA
jgi:hypothetical protein